MQHFDGLSSYDFELLVRDLLSAEWGLHLESFSSGRDGGIDVRYLGSANRETPEIIVQCKHYEKSGFSKLKSTMSGEVPKVLTKKPDRYLLATTVAMTPDRKRLLREAVGPLIKQDSDILGKEDIQALIRQHPEVEKAHFKLWLNSTAVLQRVLNNDILTRTEGYLEVLRNRAQLFVENQSVATAQERLTKHHVCIITGAPGVGKSTLADILLMMHVADGYEPVLVSEDIGEAERLYRKGAKQVFLYDDFLGRTTNFDMLGKNEDSRLVNLIQRIEASPSKRLIFTTRQYILEQARQQYERLDDPDVEIARYTLDVSVYTKSHRAHILYNHLFFSGLSDEHLAHLVESKMYLTVVQSPNFNPRIVDTAIRLAIREETSPEDLPGYLCQAFENPTDLWRHVMQGQLTVEQRAVLAILALNGSSTKLDALEQQFLELAAVDPDFSQSFDDCLRGLEGSTVSLTGSTSVSAEFVNPGVEDAVIELILSQSTILKLLIPHLASFSQVKRLWNHANEPHRVAPMFRHGHGDLLQYLSEDRILRPNLRRVLKSFSAGLLERALVLSTQQILFETPSVERRLSGILRMSIAFEEPLPEGVTISVFHVIRSRWGEGRGEKSDLWQLVRALRDAHIGLDEDVARVLQDAAEFIVCEDNSSADDFLTLHDLASEVAAGWDVGLSHRAPLPEEVVTSFGEFLPDAFERVKEGEDLTSARQTVEEWEGLAYDWGYEDISDLTSDVWSAIEEAESDDYDPESERSPSSTDHFFNKEDRDIVSLFDSLRDR